jgi:alanyl-tRNA synthetase
VFRIVSESAVSSGVRRIEALTGAEALKHLVSQENLLKSAAAVVKSRPDELPERVAGMADTVRKLERELAEAKKALALAGPGSAAAPAIEAVNGVPFLGRVIDDLDPKELRGLLDAERQSHGSGVFAIVATRDGRASIAVSVSPDLVSANSAVELVRAGVAALGGQGGGGRPDMAQGGGPEAAQAAEAIAAVKAAIRAAVPA